MVTTVVIKVAVQHQHPCDMEELIQHVSESCSYGLEVAEPEGSLYDAEIVGWRIEKGGRCFTVA